MNDLERRRRTSAQVFVDDLEHPTLDDADRHHLDRALRLRSGEIVAASDGHGAWRLCRFTGLTTLSLASEIEQVPQRSPLLTVAFSPVKGEKPEWVVQKLVELGIDRIVPVFTERSVVRWEGERVDRSHERLCRVAREAAAQSRQVFLPDVARPVNLAAFLAAEQAVCFAEPGGSAPVANGVPVLVGPEGGFTDDEVARASSTVGLPGGILRSETAAVALGVLLSAARDILPES